MWSVSTVQNSLPLVPILSQNTPVLALGLYCIRILLHVCYKACEWCGKVSYQIFVSFFEQYCRMKTRLSINWQSQYFLEKHNGSWDVKFSQQCCWKSKFSGIWCSLKGRVILGILKDHNIFIPWVKQNLKPKWSFKMLRTTCPMTQCHSQKTCIFNRTGHQPTRPKYEFNIIPCTIQDRNKTVSTKALGTANTFVLS
jgi:hypothetical protein